MTSGIGAMWDDAEEYEHLAKKYGEKVRIRPGGMWPYHMDSEHHEALKRRWRSEKK